MITCLNCIKFPFIAKTELQIRLTNTTEDNSGNVQLYHPSFGWATLCAGSWYGDVDKVICRQLGFTDVSGYLRGQSTCDESGYVTLGHINCTGNEAYIWDCDHDGWNRRDCLQKGCSMNAGASCY